MCVCMNWYINVCILYMYACMYTCMYICIYVRMYVCVCVYACIYICMCVCVYVLIRLMYLPYVQRIEHVETCCIHGIIALCKWINYYYYYYFMGDLSPWDLSTQTRTKLILIGGTGHCNPASFPGNNKHRGPRCQANEPGIHSSPVQYQ